MATPGELRTVMAQALGVPEGTVFQFDRQLAEAGLRSKGGRGTSAAKVTPADAAALLIAIAASPLSGPAIRDAVQTYRAYSGLRRITLPQTAEPFAILGLPCLSKLPQRHTFGSALAELIAGAGRGEAFGIPDGRQLLDCDPMFGVTFDGPRPWVQIVGDGSMGEHAPAEYGRLVYHNEGSKPKKRPEAGDLSQSRYITFATIRALAPLFRESR